ncbi:MAG: polysaccharide deacetylase family protein [Bacillota bacterium]
MYNKFYILFLALLVGLMVGMLQSELIVPVFGENGAYYHGVKGNNQISLMFNVDWGEDYIPDILEELDKHGVKATFFVTGHWAEQYPELLKEIVDEGHEIGNHGYNHRHIKDLSDQQIINSIKQNEKLIYEITGQKTRLFTPPYGEVDERVTSLVEDIGYKTIMWSSDTIDWQRPSSDIIIHRAINKIEDGGIILMHPTRPSVKALPQIIKNLNDRDFNFVKISQLISNQKNI